MEPTNPGVVRWVSLGLTHPTGYLKIAIAALYFKNLIADLESPKLS
jgi:hypothetical protein